MLLLIQRTFFILAAICYALTFVDGAAVVSLIMHWGENEKGFALAVWDHLEFNMGVPTVVRDWLLAIFPEPFVNWVFEQPAAAFFPVRVAMNSICGWVSMRASRAAKNHRSMHDMQMEDC